MVLCELAIKTAAEAAVVKNSEGCFIALFGGCPKGQCFDVVLSRMVLDFENRVAHLD